MSSTDHQHHQQPDELYTLRTQYMLGHYNAALLEAKQMSRRPISSNALKMEREEYIYRCYIALQQYDKCVMNNNTADGSSPGLQALVYKAQYEGAIGNESIQGTVYDQMKALASSHPSVATVQLCTAQVALMANETSYAFQLVSSSSHPECMALKVQIYLKIDRIDLAQKELAQLQKSAGEESVLVELCMIYIGLMTGRSIGNDMEHRITTLCEQYGPSVYLLNLLSIAFMVEGNPAMAESKLQECLRDFSEEMTPLQKSETLINACTVTYQQPSKSMVDGPMKVQEILTLQPPTYSSLQFKTNYERVTMAYDREAVRYMTN